MKLCVRCKIEKVFSEFHKHPCGDGYKAACKVCRKSESKTRYANSRERIKAKTAAYYREHKQKIYEHKKKWAAINRSILNENARRYNKTPKARMKKRAAVAYRRAMNLQAVPKWLTAEQLRKIKEMYANKPKGYHVDHIVPLIGRNVCGLHVPWNLQYLSAKENARKSNKLGV